MLSAIQIENMIHNNVRTLVNCNEQYRRLLASQANLMHHLAHTQQMSAEDAMERAATIEKVLEGR